MSREEYRAETRAVGDVYRAVLGKNFPVMAVVQPVGLTNSRIKVEIEATAVVRSGG